MKAFLFASDSKLSFQEIKELVINTNTSDAAPNMLMFAVPVFFVLIGLEMLLSHIHKKNLYHKKDFLASIGIGLGNVLFTALLKTSIFFIIWIVYYYLSPFSWPQSGYGYIIQFPICLIILDFFRYWAHRVSHKNRFWWATHVTHHSSEKFNFAITFRLSWVQQLKLVFFLPVALLGFDPIVFFICHQITAIYQFWVHTEIIGKLPKPIEYIFVTPSHHRVHHGTNEKYIDKNFGSTFIVWDRIFGTFQQEEEKSIYGLTKPIKSFNPIILVFQEWVDIGKDAWNAKGLKNKYYSVFGYPGDINVKN